MRRQTIIDSVNIISKDLSDSGLVKMLEDALENFRGSDVKSGFDIVSFATVQDLLVRSSRYSSDTLKIAETIGIDRVFKSAFWESFARDFSPGALMSIRGDARNAVSIFPKIVQLLAQDHVEESLSGDQNSLPHQLRGRDLVRIILAEDENEFSSPQRITSAIEGIDLLYRAFSLVEGLEGNDLILLACDSGSDKSFDFLGLANVVNGVKDTILAIWDRKVYHRHNQAAATLDVIDKSLPIIVRISEMADRGDMSPEQAQIIKNMIWDGSVKLLNSGAITPEMEASASFSPRVLMRPEPKLLAGPPHAVVPTEDFEADEDEPEENKGGDVIDDRLSADEYRQLKALMKRAAASEPSETSSPRRRQTNKNAQ